LVGEVYLNEEVVGAREKTFEMLMKGIVELEELLIKREMKKLGERMEEIERKTKLSEVEEKELVELLRQFSKLSVKLQAGSH